MQKSSLLQRFTYIISSNCDDLLVGKKICNYIGSSSLIMGIRPSPAAVASLLIAMYPVQGWKGESDSLVL